MIDKKEDWYSKNNSLAALTVFWFFPIIIAKDRIIGKVLRSMYIQHNLPGLNAKRNLNTNRKNMSRSLERLSSGYRINRAGDDAAGLAISEGMRAMIKGLDQAARNTQDGIGLVRTAEGAMQEIHAMLGRIHELSIQSANGTYNDTSREAIQEEVDAILLEIDRISEHTEFNGVQLLRGKQQGPTVTYEGTLPPWVGTDSSMQNGYLNESYTTEEVFKDQATGTETKYQIDHAATYLDFSAYTGTDAQKKELKEGGFYMTCFTCNNHYSIKFTDGNTNSVDRSGSHYIYNIGIDNIGSAQDLVQAIIAGADNGNPDNHYTKLVVDPTNPNKLIVYDDRSSAPPPQNLPTGSWPNWDWPQFNTNHNTYPNDGKFGEGVAVDPGTGGDIVFQIGPSKKETLYVDLPYLSAADLKIAGVDLTTQPGASAAIDLLDNAIDHLSTERGRMGAYENRLEHTYNTLTCYNENITTAESNIRDTDMAEEITEMTKNNIILQASQFMLNQANLVPESVLNMIQQG